MAPNAFSGRRPGKFVQKCKVTTKRATLSEYANKLLWTSSTQHLGTAQSQAGNTETLELQDYMK